MAMQDDAEFATGLGIGLLMGHRNESWEEREKERESGGEDGTIWNQSDLPTPWEGRKEGPG